MRDKDSGIEPVNLLAAKLLREWPRARRSCLPMSSGRKEEVRSLQCKTRFHGTPDKQPNGLLCGRRCSAQHLRLLAVSGARGALWDFEHSAKCRGCEDGVLTGRRHQRGLRARQARGRRACF